MKRKVYYTNNLICPYCGKAITWANTYAHVLVKEMEDNLYCPHCDNKMNIKTEVIYKYTVTIDLNARN